MYNDVVQRTQIYLDDQETEFLDRAVERTGASRSELIRRAIRGLYGTQTPQERLAAVRASAGTWRDRSGTGAEYVENMRPSLAERFSELGLR